VRDRTGRTKTAKRASIGMLTPMFAVLSILQTARHTSRMFLAPARTSVPWAAAPMDAFS
jgi:hypothetical protein